MRRVAACGFVVALAAMSACGSNDTTTPVDTITINGQVLQGTVPAAGALVYAYDRAQILAGIGDASLLPLPSPTIADGTGHFEIYGYGTLYDLTIAPSNAPLDLTLVRGLTRRDPIVTLPAVAGAPSYSCHIGMTWNAPPPTGTSLLYFLQGPGYAGTELISVKQTDANYLDGVDATWRGSFSTSATLWVVAYTKDASTGLPSAWNGSAAGTVNLVSQRETSFFTVLQPTTQTSTMFIYSQAPSGYSVDSIDVALDFGSGTRSSIAHLDGAAAMASSVTFSVPDLAGDRLLVTGLAYNGTQISYGAPEPELPTSGETTSIALQFASASLLTSPSDGATGVNSTTPFSWQGDGLNEVTFSSTAANAPSLTLLTTESSIPFGELFTSSGAHFPAGANVTWSARRYPDIGTTDFFDQSGFDVSLWRSATSTSRGFVFAP